MAKTTAKIVLETTAISGMVAGFLFVFWLFQTLAIWGLWSLSACAFGHFGLTFLQAATASTLFIAVQWVIHSTFKS